MRLFLFIYSHWDGLTLNTMSRGSSFSWSHAQESFVKKAHWLLLNLQIRLLWIIIYLTVSSGNLDNAFCMCAIFLFIHFFYANNKKSKSFSCEWILYLDWDEISFLLLCAQQGKSAARIFLYPVSIHSISHEFFIFIYAYKPTLLWANEWMG